MDLAQLDPNRFATGPEAIIIRDRIADERAIVDATRHAASRAAQVVSEKTARRYEIEQQYNAAIAEQFEAVDYARGLDARLKAQEAALDVQAAFFHPIRRTAYEVLGYIFELALPDLFSVQLYGSAEAKIAASVCHSTQFSLAAVCRRWRAASLASPRAWDTICLNVDVIQEAHIVSWVAMVSCVLLRSGCAALKLGIVRTLVPSTDAGLLQLSDCIANAMDRCALLCVYYRRLVEDDFLGPIIRTPGRSLQMLTFHLEPTPRSRDYLSSWNILSGALSISTVCCLSYYWDVVPLSPSVRNCTFDGAFIIFEEEEMVNTLQRIPHIKNLRIINTSIWIVRNPAYVCSSLDSLIIDNDGLALGGAHPVFVAPKLRKLTVWGNDQRYPLRLNYIRLVAPSATLQKLRFAGLDMKLMLDFIQTVRMLHQLVRLTLDTTHFDRIGFHALFHTLSHPGSEGKWMNPRLVRLYLKWISVSDDCDIADLEYFAKTRSNPPLSGVDGGQSDFCALERFDVQVRRANVSEDWMKASRYMRRIASTNYHHAWRYDGNASPMS